MRKSLMIAAAALIAAGPAFAQPSDYDDEWAEDAAYEEDYAEPPLAALDPRAVGDMARMMERLVGAVMDLPIGGIAQAVDPYGRSEFGRGATVRDMAERDDPYAEERIRAGLQGATRGIGVMSQTLTRMMPVLERSLDEVSRSIEQAVDIAVDGRPY